MRVTWRKLPPGPYEVGWEPALVAPAADGSPLLTDHYFPCGGEDFPTLMVRSPYGRGNPWAALYGILFAEQGFHVVVQSCRGTAGSGGAFQPWRDEAADGQAAVAWLRQQPWFNGALGTIGPSYLGYVQWALALEPPPELRAMVVQVGLHDPYAFFHAGGALHLENALVSGVGMAYLHRGTVPFLRAALRLRRWLRGAHRLRAPYAPSQPDMSGPADELPWLAEALARKDDSDPYWHGVSVGAAAERSTVPTCLIGGWQDVFLDQNIEQYRRLRHAGGESTLLIGPWTHASAFQRGWPEVFAESLAWLRAQLCGERHGLRSTGVRVHVGGDSGGEWRDLADWPPAAPSSEGRWYLASGGRLGRQAPERGADPVAEFRYDLADPTPAVGGPALSQGAGRRNNRALEAREDVLTFTGPVLDEPLEVLGAVAARLRMTGEWARGAEGGAAGGAAVGRAFDVFARLCDVDERGRSVNVCDGLVRVRDRDGAEPLEVVVPMSATARRFAAGHRVRLQVSGGAYPRFAPPGGAGDGGALRVALYPASVLELP
ncbi:CocE/NonD family hydrolase [Streptomyces sp. NPDC090442]|uniref:CocE/NonD family hydrolase n=1 Tax=Streptomyces sp. NPDC090442 TaxID=3365962 RepID=UPI00380DC53A